MLLLSYVAATIFHRLSNNLPSFYSGVVYSGQVQTPDESYYDEAGRADKDEAGVVVPQLSVNTSSGAAHDTRHYC